MGASANERVDVSEIFGRSASIFRRDALKYLLLAIILLVPSTVAWLVFTDFFTSFTADILGLVGAAWLSGSTAKAVQSKVTDPAEEISVGGLLASVWPRIASLILLMFLIWLLTAIGLVFLIVPGVILILMWSVAVPAMVLEGLGPVDSMTKSTHLTKDNRLKIFRLLLPLLVVEALMFGLGFLLADNHLVYAAIELVIEVPVYAYFGILSGVLYFQLRGAR